MTFMLNTYGFEKAKEIGERAVNRIHFSKENERFNLWSAILSLYVSNNRGNVDSVIEKALQGASKPHLIYLQYAKILNKLYEKKKQRMDATEEEEDSQSENEEDEELKNKRANELEELLTKIDQVYRKACKKYRNEKKVFEEYEQWCISTLKDIKKAEHVLNRSLKVYPQKEHISLKSKFAIILYKCENTIEARNAMENIIQNSPKRSDAWSIYLDCEQQHTNDQRYIRELFERVCNLTTLSTKKMKSFLQRYLKFETQHGDSERQEHVKQIAKEYIQSKLEKSKIDTNKD
ncbi:RRP5 protein [Naegleria gruberi]|uniref:RRP5 protein n=1 Tax=Naegleria gruberi TaxID=5762 RepID=D2UXL9_NAEGR|nr:RRP5 protein [Naegleria gruberi]EFC50307.1 RRP5 protein [Naegleria gruberi]|eukprot:XP_002683051.1 RRP5 protein [Naegleria gruberi]